MSFSYRDANTIAKGVRIHPHGISMVAMKFQ